MEGLLRVRGQPPSSCKFVGYSSRMDRMQTIPAVAAVCGPFVLTVVAIGLATTTLARRPSRRGGRGQRRRLQGRRRPRGLAAPRGADLVGAGDRLRQRRHRGEQPARQRGRPAGSARMDRRGRARPLARLCVGLTAGVCMCGDLRIVWRRSLASAPPAADRGPACALQPARPLPGRRLQPRVRRGK